MKGWWGGEDSLEWVRWLTIGSVIFMVLAFLGSALYVFATL